MVAMARRSYELVLERDPGKMKRVQKKAAPAQAKRIAAQKGAPIVRTRKPKPTPTPDLEAIRPSSRGVKEMFAGLEA
jgi:hypothetical protein